ncbi:TonB-dependent receptor [Halosquirtibacter laminarini]|uniref:TonB-dependent receptor n=1 Tax=Halosquirtibacter laminarini TaxID=3374600 RepID=A0AC61NB96_9BACT|nr:TonB-dependent receptor [Prolixibacteraceae bacterium]
MTKLIVATLFTFLFPFMTLCADPENKDWSTIYGVVLDEKGNPLPGAVVYDEKDKNGVITDLDGHYRLNVKRDGTHIVVYRYLGYESISFSFASQKEVMVKKNVTLSMNEVLDVVNVNGFYNGELRALAQQKSSDHIQQVISATQIAKFPDSNVGESLKRIPGVSIQYDQGEARFGNIRGTSPQYNSVTINGDRMPSAEAETRANQLDLIPSDMVESIEVSKVITPDMDADAIGGTINLVTKSAPNRQTLSTTFSTGWNVVAQKPSYNGFLLWGNRFFKSKLGVVLSVSYQNNELGSDNIEAEWENSDQGMYTSDFQIRQYYIQRERVSYSSTVDLKLNPNHTIKATGIYNQRKDWENRYRLRYKDVTLQDDGSYVAEMRRQTKGGTNKMARLEDQINMNYGLSGEHHWGRVTLDWRLSYAKASESRPNERYLSVRSKEVVVDGDFSDPKKPLVSSQSMVYNKIGPLWKLKELTEENQWTYDEDKNAKVDLELPILDGVYRSKVKIGGRLRLKSKVRDNRFYDYEPLDESMFMSNVYANQSYQTRDGFQPGEKYSIGNFVDIDYLSSLDLQNGSSYESTEVLEEEAVNFTAKENVYSSYIRYDQKLGNKLKVIGGVRLEATDISYDGFQYYVDSDGEASLTPTDKSNQWYWNLLPSVILKYKISDALQYKASWTNTLSRPKYYSLVPYRNVNIEDNKISIGNPTLKPTLSSNFDMMLEYYGKENGAFSIGVFYKDIDDFIVSNQLRDYLYDGQQWDVFSQDINGGSATIKGIEVSMQQPLSLLGALGKHFSFFVNYTYTISDIQDFQVKGRENEKLSLPGTPKHSLNLSLAFENRWLTLRSSYNYSSEFIDEFGATSFYDKWYDQVQYLDVNASVKLNKTVNIFGQVNNILNQPLRYYQGKKDYVMQEEYYGVRGTVGIRLMF